MAFDTYITFDGGPDELKGEATGLKDGIEIYSFSLGASAPVTIGPGTGGASASRVSLSSFSVMKKTDKTSPALFLHCCKGSHVDKMIVHMRKQTGVGGQQEFLTYEFEQVFVESIQWSGSSGGDDTPSESVSFAYGKVTITYKAQKPDGTLDAGTGGTAMWDVRVVESKKA